MKLKVRELVVFGMLGATMYASKVLMEFLPNVHLLGAFIVSITLVYGKKALYPIYTYVLLLGVFSGFSAWWVPNLYIWTVLWAAVMPLRKHQTKKWSPILYMALNSLHGFLFGVLYAPAQALLFGLNFQGMLAWIAAGIPFDLIHGVSNFCCGVLIRPLVNVMRRAEKAVWA